jgi:hypothetical protein
MKPETGTPEGERNLYFADKFIPRSMVNIGEHTIDQERKRGESAIGNKPFASYKEI